ncbi:hypothetical protein GCM10029976_004400 [Kribbella albertanoniae]
MKRQARTGGVRQQPEVYVEDAIRTGAFLVAMSLWHSHPQKTKLPSMNEAVKQIDQEVLTTWPTEAISHAENVVYRLYGMYEFVVNDAPEQAEDAGPASLFCGKVFDGELSFALKLAREMGDPTGAPCLPGCHPRSMPTGTAFTVPIIFMMFCWICTFPG